jgi:hypothetical protein
LKTAFEMSVSGTVRSVGDVTCLFTASDWIIAFLGRNRISVQSQVKQFKRIDRRGLWNEFSELAPAAAGIAS